MRFAGRITSLAKTEAPDLSGTRLGRYEIVSLLGQGGMGAVYDAVDPALDRHVALKILPSAAVADPQRASRFVTEARAASALNHPHVVSIYEIGEADGVHYIAMERVDGVTLRTLLAGARLPVARAVAILADVADAVAAAHSAGVVHRDLKPENIMVARGGYPKVLDFGLAKLRPAESWSEDGATAVAVTASGIILGTAGYMSPEQARGRDVDHRTDIFALGCILYEAVSGRRAFAGQSHVETLQQIISGEPEPLTGVPDELQRIVRKAMAKDRDARYQSAREMALDLRELSRQLDRPAPLRLPSRGRRALAAAAAVVLIAFVAAAIYSRWPRTSGQHVAQSLTVQRVTARGIVTSVAISPDGKYAAYSSLDNVLRLRQLATGQELELVNSKDQGLWGQTFTPDGNAIVYGTKSPGDVAGALYRIATIGGRSEHLVDGMDSPPTFSPDGKRMAWVRAEFPRPTESALMTANSDGSDARALISRKPPELLAPCFFCGPSWSPDGQSIAVSMIRDADPRTAQILIVDAVSGEQRPLLHSHWQSISQVAWLPDGGGITFIGADQVRDLTQMQVWVASYPSGTVHRVTNELVGYRGVSLSADGQSLLTVGFDVSAQIWAVPLGEGQQQPPRKISTGKFDGWEGLACTTDGRVVYASIEDTSPALYIANADGSGRAALTRDHFDNRLPAAFPGGVAYLSSSPAGNDICIIGLDGEGRRAVVHGVDVAPVAVSPDGKSLVFSRSRRLWKTTLDGKATPVPLTSDVSSGPSWSPAGDRIAFFTGDPDTYGSGAAVMDAKDGRIVARLQTHVLHGGSTIRWVRDGSALIINDGVGDDMNLWLYSFNGSRRRLTSFVDQRAFYWDLLPDGRTAMVSRAAISRDAVRLTGFH